MTPPPLTAFCLSMSERAIMNVVMTVDSTSEHKRAQVLSMFIMMAAGHFVGRSLQWAGQKGAWDGSPQFMRDTNLDVITAETIVWMTFLMGQLWKADQKKDHEMFLRVGFVTISTAGEIALRTIKSKTGVDFRASAIESRKLYIQSMKDGSGFVEPFASVLLRSVGCRSLSEPPKAIGPVPPLELTPITLAVSIFFSTMSPAFYESFKNVLREYSNRFPHDEDSGEEAI